MCKVLLLLFSLILLLDCFSSASGQTNTNLVGWWKMDDTATGTVVDSSGRGRDGTLHGNAHFVSGFAAEALALGGNPDYVTIDDYKGILRNNPFSITAWVKTSDNEGCIVSWGNPAVQQRVEFRISQNRLRFEHGNGNMQGVTNVNDNEWHHVAVTVKRRAILSHPDIVLYLDGKDDTGTRSSPHWFDIQPNFDVTIGRRYNNESRWLEGLIDDVRLCDAELGQGGVQEIMAGDPTDASEPAPGNGSSPDIERASQLTWKPGSGVEQHDVYFGTNTLAVDAADMADTSGIYRGRHSQNSYVPPESLGLDQTYYWRIDEVKADGTITPGRIWTFTTVSFFLIDDFEDYNDFEPNTIYSAWSDGYGKDDNGSQAGYVVPPIAERGIVHDGLQAMPLLYDNSSAPISEAELPFDMPRDWTRHGIKALSFWIHGSATNSAEPLYVALQDSNGLTSVVTHENPKVVQLSSWLEWNIALERFVGVDLQSITKVIVGVGNTTIPDTGAQGKILLDDIRLYRPRCVASLMQPAADLNGDCAVDCSDLGILSSHWLEGGLLLTPADPGTDGLVAHYPFEENVNDVVGGHNGQTKSVPEYVSGMEGQAISLDGVEDHVVVGALGISGVAGRTIAGWAKADTVTDMPNWANVFGFVGPETGDKSNQFFDIEKRGGQDYYCLHVNQGQWNFATLDLGWHHLAATYDGTTIRMYENGRFVDSVERELKTRDQFQIGRRADQTKYFAGSVDEVRVYDRALSEAEIAWLASHTTPLSTAADLHQDGQIDLKDYAVLADHWLEELLWPIQ